MCVRYSQISPFVSADKTNLEGFTRWQPRDAPAGTRRLCMGHIHGCSAAAATLRSCKPDAAYRACCDQPAKLKSGSKPAGSHFSPAMPQRVLVAKAPAAGTTAAASKNAVSSSGRCAICKASRGKVCAD